MTSRYSFWDEIVASVEWLLKLVLPAVFAIVIVASPWVYLYVFGWRLFLRLYPVLYLCTLAGFALIMALLNRRELLVRVRKWRAARRQTTDLKKAA